MKKSIASAAAAAALFVTGSAFAAGQTVCAQATRGDVQRDYQEWKVNPVAADGARWVGGELGWSADAPRAARSGQASAGIDARTPGSASLGELRLVPGELGWVAAKNDLRNTPAGSYHPAPAVVSRRGSGAESGWRLAYGDLGLVAPESSAPGRIAGCVAQGAPSIAHFLR